MNILRFLNYKLVNYQMKKGHKILFGKPYFMVLDLVSFCNLECVCCPTGQHKNTRTACTMSKDKAINIIRKFGKYLKEIMFFNWGEPLLHSNIIDIIKEAKKYNIKCWLSSNLNTNISKDLAKELVKNIDIMICSIDGASQETYEKYRKKGNFNLALSNLKLLVETRKELNINKSELVWQFLVFKHNEHEIEYAKKIANEIGADIVFRKPWCPQEMVSTIDKYSNYNLDNGKKEYKTKEKFCNWLWNAIVINANGSVSPCCSVENESEDFGNIFTMPFYKLWNNKNYREARKYNITKQKTNFLNRCITCEHIGTANHECK